MNPKIFFARALRARDLVSGCLLLSDGHEQKNFLRARCARAFFFLPLGHTMSVVCFSVFVVCIISKMRNPSYGIRKTNSDLRQNACTKFYVMHCWSFVASVFLFFVFQYFCLDHGPVANSYGIVVRQSERSVARMQGGGWREEFVWRARKRRWI